MEPLDPVVMDERLTDYTMARQPGQCDPVLPVPARNPQGDLHHQCD